MDGPVATAVKQCQDVQHMIDITSEHLDRLRSTFSNAGDELTKQEIRTLEGKLIKQFSEQLAIKSGLGIGVSDNVCYPSLSQWLRVVGVSGDTSDVIRSRVRSLEELKDKTDSELKRILLTASRVSPGQRHEDLRRLCRSLLNLRKYTDALVYGNKVYGPNQDPTKLELHWDSWNQILLLQAPLPQGSECSSPTRQPHQDPIIHSEVVSAVRPPGNQLEMRHVSIQGGEPTKTPREISARFHGTQSELLTNRLVSSMGDTGMRSGESGTRQIGIPFDLSSRQSGGQLDQISNRQNDFSLPGARFISTEDQLYLRSLPLRDKLTSRAGSQQTDSAASSLSSTSSCAPPSSPGYTLSPPVVPSHESRGTGSNMITPPATPPWLLLSSKDRLGSPAPKHSTATPPASKKHSTSVTREYSLSKSKSHESELSQRIDPETGQEVRLDPGERVDSSGYSSSSEATGPNSARKRLHSSEPESSSSGVEQTVYQGPSPIASPKSPPANTSQLKVPRSPHTPGPVSGGGPVPVGRAMTHTIAHRFTKTFKPGRCGFCQEYFFQGLKCKECKFRIHTTCENQVPPSCGLPDQLLDLYFEHLTSKEGSPSLPRAPAPPFDSSSSSCNSSTPSSPQVIVTSHPEPTPPWSVRSVSSQQHFQFPEPSQPPPQVSSTLTKPSTVPAPVSNLLLERVVSPNPAVDTVKSNDSDKTLSGSSDSIGTAYRLDSQDSTTSVEGDGCSTWSSGRQMSIREWDIPYEELKIGDKIGSGRFSTVHAGNWHGDVAIKILDMENLEDENTSLEAFKLDVATFRKTRHENLVLFMGACMKPPHLAIVTSLCKGNTLYTHLHLRRDKFYMNKVIIIAQQIAQGMGYLHHKGIIHKDLKTKNIFLENGRAIITDFGLVNVARRLCSRYKKFGNGERLVSQECMSIPAGWLCYLAPEVIRELKVTQKGGEDLPFTRASDVYAFGTVWYELLTGEWPWKRQPPESIIWQVGKGIKPTLANLQASREVKDVLVQCWLFSSRDRPDFTAIARTLERLPKKRLARSPSHPIHLSRSAEALF